MKILKASSILICLLQFIYCTVVIAQDWVEVKKFTPINRNVSDWFGRKIAIDGDYIFVSAHFHDFDEREQDSIINAGAAYIFRKGLSGQYEYFQKVAVKNRNIADFFSVDISIDGDRAIIGADGQDTDENDSNYVHGAGAAYIFQLDSNGTWLQHQKLVANDRSDFDNFGWEVGISGDYAVVAAFNDADDSFGGNPITEAGSAYIFERDTLNNQWVQVQKITSPDRGNNERFGTSIEISGSTIVVGIPNDGENATGGNSIPAAGSVCIFDRDANGVWTLSQKIVQSQRQVDDFFGNSVAIEGSRLLVGATGEDEDENNSNSIVNAGAAYVYQRGIGLQWNLQQKIVGSDRFNYSDFGSSVSINNNSLLVGEYKGNFDNNGLNLISDAGSAYLYSRNSMGIWLQEAKLTASDRGKQDWFAIGLDLSENTAVIGAWGDDHDILGLNPIQDAGSIYFYKNNVISGSIYNDINSNCAKEPLERGIPNMNGVISPGNLVVTTASSGTWYVDSLPPGNFSINYSSLGNWQSACSTSYNFTVHSNDSSLTLPDFGLTATMPCASPDISIVMPRMRPCFQNQPISLHVCNSALASGAYTNSFAIMELDSNIVLTSASQAYITISNNKFQFDFDSLYPGQCKSIYLYATVSCNAVQGQTLCMSVELFPVDTCSIDSTSLPFSPIGQVTPCNTPWDNSSLSVEGECHGDSITFTISNVGISGINDMTCYAPVRLYRNALLENVDSVLISGGDSMIFKVFTDSSTWRLETMQHPQHPGTSTPNATVEFCGQSSNWTPGAVNLFPEDDTDPHIDIYCGEVTASYDPNDKNGFPIGVTDWHFIPQNQKINYVIRFQNTGTDTAFTVVIRDTLDMNLDILSVTSGAASHTYSFTKYGPRILEWTFSNILLPDSIVNEDASNGFVSFSVDQMLNVPLGSKIANRASIYFDFNDPIVTNTTLHTIQDIYQSNSWIIENSSTVITCDSANFFGNYYSTSGQYFVVRSDTLYSMVLTVVQIDTTISRHHGQFTSNQNQSSYQWVDCGNGFSYINGATAQNYFPPNNGSYAVIISNNNCIDTSSCYTISNVFIIESDFGDNFLIYPNPTTGRFTIDLGRSYDSLTVSLFNIYGQMIQQQESENTILIELDIDEPAGMYIVKLNTNSGSSAVLRLVKQ